MEVDRGLSLGRLALVVATLGLVTGCSLLESRADPPPPRPLALRSVTPGGGPIGRTPVIRLTFDGYLEDDSFRSYDAAHLQSGGIARGGLAQYSFVHNRLTWRPFSPLP
ncbi:MAG: hypothetical protein ABEL76_11315, partial [Bradymonadaceae bacterium]